MEAKKLIKDLDPKSFSAKERELYNYNESDRVLSSKELQEELSLSEDSIFNYKTGIESLDRILDGVEAGELIVITGLSGQGKTALMMTLTSNLAESGAKSVWFTLEVTARQFLKKISQRTNKIPEFYAPRENTENTIKWIEERIVESNVKYNTRIVFIDHINMIYSIEASKGNTSLEIGDMVAKIKQIALKHNQIVFLVAHCKDPVDNKEPNERSIRDSGMILRLADTVLGIWRIQNDDHDGDKLKEIGEDDTQAKIKVFKNRRTGQLGKFFMDHKNSYFSEIKADKLQDMADDLKEKPRQRLWNK